MLGEWGRCGDGRDLGADLRFKRCQQFGEKRGVHQIVGERCGLHDGALDGLRLEVDGALWRWRGLDSQRRGIGGGGVESVDRRRSLAGLAYRLVTARPQSAAAAEAVGSV